jgi:phosphatidylserine decarboxylase
MLTLKNRLFLFCQYALPQHLLSRASGWLTNNTHAWLKNKLITTAIKRYHINIAEAESGNLDDYPTFNAFFTRTLKPGARPLPTAADAIISPADGVISQMGPIQNGTLIQAKGHDFTVEDLLGFTPQRPSSSGATRGPNQKIALSAPFAKGNFATIYLSPKDYHRVHMPFGGTLTGMSYIPGKLFSVSLLTAAHVPNLFARNERVVCHFDTSRGRMAVVFVGAFFVASIQTVFAGTIAPGGKDVQHTDYRDKNLVFNRGDELGRFLFGSTVIVLSEDESLGWKTQENVPIQLNQTL